MPMHPHAVRWAMLWAWWNGGGVTHLGDEDGPLCGQRLGVYADGSPDHPFQPSVQGPGMPPSQRYCRRCLKLHGGLPVVAPKSRPL